MQIVWVVIYGMTDKLNPEFSSKSCRVYSNYDIARQEIAEYIQQEDDTYEYWIETFDNVLVQ